MLDAFLEVLVEKEARHSAREEMADAFMSLPTDELHKIASGSLKLADYDDHEWLSKFKGTPLYEPALQLEQQCLELDIQQQQAQQARSQESESDKAIWDAKDGIRLKKRMLDLELLKMESSTEAGGAIASGQPAPDMQQEQAAAQPAPQGVAGAPNENVPKQASSPLDEILKVAAELQAGQREKIKGKNFAVKGGKYPIHDQSHASNALTRVRQFGSPAEKAQVFAAVTKKYPALSTRSSVIPEKTQAKAEKKLGLPKGGESQKQEAPKQKLGEAILSMRMEKVALSLGALNAAGIGAGVGALGGALTGGAKEPGGQSHRLRNALIGAGVGAGVGVGGSALASRLAKAAPAAAPVERAVRSVSPTMGMEALASARVLPPDILAAMRMQKLAAMGKHSSAVEAADAWGRQLAQMEKEAINLAGIGTALKGIGGRALTAAKANPNLLRGAAIGAGVGALGGAAAGGEGHRLSGALKGGLLGGAVGGTAGYAAPKIQSAMKGGQTFGQAAKGTGQKAWGGLKNIAQGPQTKLNLPKGGIGNAPLQASAPVVGATGQAAPKIQAPVKGTGGGSFNDPNWRQGMLNLVG